MIERFISSLIARPFSRLLLCVTVWMTYKVVYFSFEFAMSSPGRSGMDVAAILAAINVPFCAMQTFCFRAYTDGKQT